MSFQPMHGSLLMHVGYIDNGYPQYEVGTTRLVIVTNSDNPVKQISFDQVQAIFTGRINNWSAISGENANVQVWIFPGGDDIQMIFQESVLEGIPISTSARVATTAGEMSTAISLDPNAIGIITRQTLPDNVTVSLELVDLPVLVTLMNEPDALTLDLIDCMQKQP
jgi:ABC-type phosphate transport system substrate-binding protein